MNWLVGVLACGSITAVARRVGGTWSHPGVLFGAAWTVFLAIPAFVVPNLTAAPQATLVIVLSTAAAAMSACIRIHSPTIVRREPAVRPPVRWLVLVGGAAGFAASIVVQRAHGYSLSAISSLQAVTAAARSITIDRYSSVQASIPAAAVILLALTYAGALAAPFVAAGKGRLRAAFYLSWPTLGAAAYAVATTARAPFLISAAITASGSLVLVTLKSSNGRRIPIRAVLSFAIAGFSVAATFVWVAFARVGQGAGNNVREVIIAKVGVYLGGSVPALNSWINSGEHAPPQYGVRSLAGVLKYAVGRPSLGNAYDLFVPVNTSGSQYTNVFTALRQAVEDFTLPGAILVLLVVSLLAAEALRRALHTGSVPCLLAAIAWNSWILFSQTASIFQFTNVCIGLAFGGVLIARNTSLVAESFVVPSQRKTMRPSGEAVTAGALTSPRVAIAAGIQVGPSSHVAARSDVLFAPSGNVRSLGLSASGGGPPTSMERRTREPVKVPHPEHGLRRSLGIYWLAKAIPGLLFLIGTVVLLRAGGKSAYGIYALAWSAAAFAGNLATGWQCQASLRFSSARRLATRFLWLRPSLVSIAVGSGAACAIAGPLFPTRNVGEFVVLLAGTYLLTATSAAQTLLLSVHQANLSPSNVLLGETVRAVISLGAPLLLLAVFPSVPATALVYGMMLAQSASLAVLCYRNRHATWTPDPSELKMWWSYGWPMGIWLSGAVALQFSDRFFIQYYLGSAVTGNYSAVYDLLNRLILFGVYPVTMATHPVISRLWNSGRRREAMALNRRAILFQITLFAPVMTVLVLFRSWWMSSLLNEPRHYLALVVPIALGAFTWQLALSLHKSLEMARRTRLMLVYIFVSLLLNVILNYVFVPRYGAIASAWATLAASGAYFLLCLGSRKTTDSWRVDAVMEVEPALRSTT